MKQIFALIFAVAASNLLCSQTVVLQSPFKSQPGYLGTCEYSPLPIEEPFYEKVSADNRSTVSGYSLSEEEFFKSSFFKSGNPQSTPESLEESKPQFSLEEETGEYVGWYGLVTEVERSESGIVLTIQNKYSNGTTDCHMQTVSLYGAGDFSALVDSDNLDFPPLSLVKVYGVVGKSETGTPIVETELIRYWRWLSFNFSEYGLNAGLSKKYRNMDLSDLKIYNSRPDGQYYIDRIDAPRERFVGAVEWWNANKEELWKEQEEAENKKAQQGVRGNED